MQTAITLAPTCADKCLEGKIELKHIGGKVVQGDVPSQTKVTASARLLTDTDFLCAHRPSPY